LETNLPSGRVYVNLLEDNKVDIVHIQLLNMVEPFWGSIIGRKATGNHDGNVHCAPAGTRQILWHSMRELIDSLELLVCLKSNHPVKHVAFPADTSCLAEALSAWYFVNAAALNVR
jgi:hypothetical protein